MSKNSLLGLVPQTLKVWKNSMYFGTNFSLSFYSTYWQEKKNIKVNNGLLEKRDKKKKWNPLCGINWKALKSWVLGLAFWCGKPEGGFCQFRALSFGSWQAFLFWTTFFPSFKGCHYFTCIYYVFFPYWIQ